MAELGSLSVEITANTKGLDAGIGKAEKSLKDFSRTGDKAAGSLKGFDSEAKASAGTMGNVSSSAAALTKRIAALAAAYVGLQTVSKIVDTTAEFQKLEASLTTVTGSVDKAQEAFKNLQTFATETPFALTEVTDAFIKMKSIGLDPSDRALRSYGDTASSMGKSLNQMIEAVADAATGEFERLKEFGIRASSEGDRVTFTFRGMTTEVQKSAGAIENYLMSLGEVNFAGGMQRQMDTIGGQLSNMGDQWDKTFAAIGDANSGLIGGVISGITSLGSALEDFFLTAEEWAIKYGHVASEAERLETSQRVVNLQLKDAEIELERVTALMDQYTQAFVSQGMEVNKNTEYYRQLSSQLQIAQQEFNALSQEAGNLDWGAEADFDTIEKQFADIAKINADYAEMMKEDKVYQEELWLEALKEFHQEYKDEIDAAAEYRNNVLAGQLEKLREAGLSEIEIIEEKHMTEMEQLEEFLEQKLITQQEYDKLLLESTLRREEAINDIEEKASKQRQNLAKIEARNREQAVQGMWNNLTSLMNSKSREAFEIGKTAAIAETVINTYKSATGAYSALASIPYVGPALGAAAAAAAITSGMNQVNNIKSQTFSRGGGGGAATQTAQASASSQGVNGQGGGAGGTSRTLLVQGDFTTDSLFTGDTVRRIIDGISEANQDGYKVVM